MAGREDGRKSSFPDWERKKVEGNRLTEKERRSMLDQE